MPALNFQRRFAAIVGSGYKRQTIRKRRKDGRDPKPGDTLYLFTDMRSKECRSLGHATCTSVTSIRLRAEPGVGLLVDLLDCTLGAEATDALAEADGFDDSAEMGEWFERTHGLPFEGLLIRWDTPVWLGNKARAS